MATRSFIGFMEENGNIKASYCHYDGYLEGVGALLKEEYTNVGKIRKLVDIGYISALFPTIEQTKKAAANKDTPSIFDNLDTQTNILDFIGMAKNCSCEFAYLYNSIEDKWQYKDLGIN